MAFSTRLKLVATSDRLIRRNPVYYAKARRLIETLDLRDDSGRHVWKTERLNEVLSAARTTTYGRTHGKPSALASWPILEKQAIRDDPDAFITAGSWLSIPAATSGTTGTPLQLRRSLESVAYEQAVVDALMERAGATTRSRGAVLRGDDIKDPADRSPPFWRLANGGRRLIFSSNHLDGDSLGDFVAALREYSPDVLFAYPTVLEALCALMLERGEALRIPLTVCGSEVLTRATCELARTALGTEVLCFYGQAERVAFAYGDPERGFRLLPSYSVNELQLAEAADDSDTYELIATGLWNRTMPLVRYRTGDLFRLRKGADPSAVAEGREPLLAIIGRSGDFLVSPSGTPLTGIDHIPRNVPHVVRTQFIQDDPSSVRMLVLPAPGFGEASHRLLMQHARAKLPPSMSVRIEVTTQLVKNASGKSPLVVRSIEPAMSRSPLPRDETRQSVAP
ncbi:MAG TPA: hypothetical protein VEV18_00310 [Steroidobacteraceae bacterium]|nr:hypothetical protein [Steroidobacteraceae bacterium]